MIVNSKGMIVADLGIRWARYITDEEWWSVEPFGYRIRPKEKHWLLYRAYPSTSLLGYTVVQRIFLGHTYEECMRAAEIFQIRRAS